MKIKKLISFITMIGIAYVGYTYFFQKVPAGRPDTHIGTSGENLSLIAKKYSLTVQDLIEYNPDIFNPDIIYPGQVIYLKSVYMPTV